MSPGRAPRARPLAWIAAWLAVLVAFGGCASAPPSKEPDAAGEIVGATLQIDGTGYAAHWYLPSQEAAALIVLQPGYTRHCRHLRGTTLALTAAGVMALCIDASMAAGNPALAEALAARLVTGLEPPQGRALPATIIVGGHSAGGRFAARLGARLAELAPERLAGALLFDPVATAGFERDLRSISDAGLRPVVAVLAGAHACNAELNGAPALRRVRQDALAAGRTAFVGIQLTEGATHADVEGEDSDWIAALACGRPLPANVALLRAWAVRWTRDIAQGAAPAAPEGTGWRAIE